MNYKIKIATIVGARPQFIKASIISLAISEWNQKHPGYTIQEVLINTGQHYNEELSDIFFKELDIQKPDFNLGVGSGLHGFQTGRMLIEIEKVLIDEKPDFVLVYGDTNSTLAGALAAKKLHIPIAHIEAGLRSFNMRMPEEINRIVTDRISDILFCPTETAVRNLHNEGIFNGVHNVGDVMYESIIVYRKKIEEKGVVLSLMDLKKKEYVLATIHRAENTDDIHRLKNILSALNEISKLFTVVFPIHPRTSKEIKKNGLEDMLKNIYCIKPLSYFDMMNLEQFARVILTDSGGVQKEAFFHGVPSITLRDETEWAETLQGGWNTIAGTNTESIMKKFDRILNTSLTKIDSNPFGDGTSSKDILNVIFEKFHFN